MSDFYLNYSTALQTVIHIWYSHHEELKSVLLLQRDFIVRCTNYYSTLEIPSDFPYLGARSLRFLPECSPRCAGRPTA